MNPLGRRSLSSFFELLLDVAFYAACLAGALSVVIAVAVVVALDAIIATVVQFRGTARQSDDITMMLVSRDGAA